jgi:hypothetical protein
VADLESPVMSEPLPRVERDGNDVEAVGTTLTEMIVPPGNAMPGPQSIDNSLIGE